MRSTTARGYGWQHQQIRERWRADVEAGLVSCWRCGQPIARHQPWDLGHDDSDPTKRTYKGPEHQHCNRSAGGAKGEYRRGWAWSSHKPRRIHPDLTT